MHVEDYVGLLGLLELEPWDCVGHIDNGYGEDEEEEIGGGGEFQRIRHGFWVLGFLFTLGEVGLVSCLI